MSSDDTGVAKDSGQLQSSPAFRGLDLAVYIGIALCSLINALIGPYTPNADVVAYLDLSDALRHHLWHSAVNAYWFPLYPSLLALAKSLSGHGLRHELQAARLLDCGLELFFVFAAVVFAASARRLMLSSGVRAAGLLPRRTLYLWTAIFAYYFTAVDLINMAPDALVSALLVLTVACLMQAMARGRLTAYAAVGLFGGLAFWAKAFAFPFFLLCILFVGIANLRRSHVLHGLVLAVAVFGLVAGPYMGQISKAKGRFTYGDSGRLVGAWYVNGADRFDAVPDPTIYQPGSAVMQLKHPGELLARSPEVAYYDSSRVYGSTPQWDDPSYWEDGLKSRFILRQTLDVFRRNAEGLSLMAVMRLPAVVFILMLPLFGFSWKRRVLLKPSLLAVFLVLFAAIGLYMLILAEGRYLAFAFVMIGVLCAASTLTGPLQKEDHGLHLCVALMAALVLIGGAESNLKGWKIVQASGANPLHGVYDAAVSTAGAELAAKFAPGTEVACMGDAACWADPYWAHYAGVKVTAVVETSHGVGGKSAGEGCRKLEQAPEVLDILRKRHIRAIVARYGGTEQPCSAQWQPLGSGHAFFYLPL